MKAYIKYPHVFFIILLVGVSAGSDFLEEPPQGELIQQTFPTTANDALLATHAMYNLMRTGGFHQGLFPILDIMSDDARKGSNPGDGASTVGTYDNFTHIPT